MKTKMRFTVAAIYTVGCFAIMLIGFDWKVSISVSLIIGSFAELFNEIIQLLMKINKILKDTRKW